MPNFTPAAILAGLVVTAVGTGLFIYGKKQRRAPQMIAGVLMMGFPYFFDGGTAIFLVGAGILACMWASLRLGM